MKNLELFHQLVHGECSFVHNVETHQKQINYLKNRYPAFIQHYHICVKINEDGCQIKDQQQFVFTELPVVRSYQESITISVDKLPQTLRILLNDTLASTSSGIMDLWYYENEGYSFLEVITSQDYESLSAQEVRFYYFQVMMDEALSAIKKHLHKKIFVLDDEKKIQRHVKRYQNVINAYLENILSEYLSVQQQTNIYNISETKSLTDVYKLIFQKLEEVQVYLEKTFQPYLNLSSPIPYCHKIWLAATYRKKLEALLSQLQTLGLPKELVALVSLPLENLLKVQTMKFNHYDQQYHISYTDALIQFLSQHPSPTEYATICFLKNLNFNTLKFFLYVTEKISDELKQKDTAQQKLQTLYYYEKCLRESPIRTEGCYNRELPSFQEQMSGWFTENIQFYKRKRKQEKQQHDFAGLPQQTNQKQTFKLSVAELSLVTRLFYEHQMLEGTRQSVLEFVCQHFSTVRTPSISEDSLDRKYYSTPLSAKRNIRKLLKSMLSQLDEQIK